MYVTMYVGGWSRAPAARQAMGLSSAARKAMGPGARGEAGCSSYPRGGGRGGRGGILTNISGK